jgi:hypothetical protein
MARIRTVKPEFWSDEKLSPLPPIDRLVFLGLICMADDAGRLLDNAKVIDAFVFPNSLDSAAPSVERLVLLGRVLRGRTSSGQAVLQIANWSHQKIDKPNLSSALPPIAGAALPSEPFVDASSTLRRHVDDTSAPLSAISYQRSTISDPLSASSDHARADGDKAPVFHLVTAANDAITARFGSQAIPLSVTHPSSAKTAADLAEAGVPIAYAVACIAEKGRALKTKPGSLAYFTNAILEQWAKDSGAAPKPSRFPTPGERKEQAMQQAVDDFARGAA